MAGNIYQSAFLFKEIGKLSNSGDKVTGNLRMVSKVAQKFVGLGLDFDELISEGTIGLVTASNRFDDSKGASFSTYAHIYIDGFIKVALVNKGRMVRVPSGKETKEEYKTSTVSIDTFDTAVSNDTSKEQLMLDILRKKLTQFDADAQKIMKMKLGIDEYSDTDPCNKRIRTYDAIANEMNLPKDKVVSIFKSTYNTLQAQCAGMV